MPRLVYLTGLALLLLCGAFLLTDALLSPWPGVTEANPRRVSVGMNVKEVEAIFGGPGATGRPVSWIPRGLPLGERMSPAV